MSNVSIYQSEFESVLDSFLRSKNTSVKTRTNYKSDLKHFMSWVSIRFQNLGIKTHSDIDLISNITEKLILEYINHQLQNNIPEASINRRLSTVRIFFTAAWRTRESVALLAIPDRRR